MTAPAAQGPPGLTPPRSEANVPRKRRKRAPAAGAGADCFTCTSRNIKCDRRRPFCSQCLEDGKDCSGYKTQLTWGNGVASRGKLRGLTLPIVGTQKVAATLASPEKPVRRLSQQQPEVFQHGLGVTHPPAHARGMYSCGPPTLIMSPVSDAGNSGFQYNFPVPAATAVPASYGVGSWGPPAVATAPLGDGIKIEPPDAAYASGIPVPLRSPLDPPPYSAGLHPGMGYSASDRVSPGSYSAASPESAYFGPVASHNSGGVSSSLSSFPVSPRFPAYENSYPEHHTFPTQQNQNDAYAVHQSYDFGFQPHQYDPSLGQDREYPDEMSTEEVEPGHYDDGCAIAGDSMLAVAFPPLSGTCSLASAPYTGVNGIGATPRMQYLINYYTEVISPVIVAFDSPSNPYRTEILRLAAKSETLQHAISALAASNLRQRQESGALSTGKTAPARRSSMAHLSLTNERWHKMGLLSPEEQIREETLHKGIAIQSLNKQLADPELRKNDTILATLLILCLFHICDSGVAKFQTQFAGVKKLLSLRMDDFSITSKETRWFAKMFTWFDAFTATVNNREGQLQGHYIDISALSDDEWALENLAGCDGQLFKIIARLGRLNVLAQGKSVDSNPTIVPRPAPNIPVSPNFDYSGFDGNGWMRIVEDENLFASRTAERDAKTQFWREWREIRHALQQWQLDAMGFETTSPEARLLTVEQRMDLVNISESFRYSALLYTERLANPTLPSSDPCIRSWVHRSLMYIKAVKSDVYLLWPLFITGSECVEEHDRAVIRERCLDIQKDSGFLNNKSCLELLEKVWKRSNDISRRKPRMLVQEKEEEEDVGLRFASVMRLEGNEGEYIVV